ncbi:hypothetical protein BJV74DRAFT_888894 [Russula compacta]|nr:hypothetical protein BJV74DRAFT_888894 [Russula compacta]
MFTLPAGSVNGFYSSWQHHTDVSIPSGSGSLPSRTSRPSSPLPTISELFHKRSSLPVRPRPPLPLLDLQNSESPQSLYPRPVRPPRLSGVESIPESAGTSLESLGPPSSRSVSMSTSLQGNSPPVADKEATYRGCDGDLIRTLRLFSWNFVPSRTSSFASWKSLLKVKAYEEKQTMPSLRATRIYADTLLCVHNEIVERHSVDAQELICACIGLNEAIEDAFILLSDAGTIPQDLEYISALDADLFKSFVVTIMQLVRLIRALEALVDTLAILAVVNAPTVTHKANLDDDVIFNVPGWRRRNESGPTLHSAAPVLGDEAVDDTLRLLLVTRNEELEHELRGLRFLLWCANPKAKARLGNIVKLKLPLHYEELMRSPVEDFVVHWQAAVEQPGHGSDDQVMESDDTSSW